MKEIEEKCITFVRDAVHQGLAGEQSFGIRGEQRGITHLGSTDIYNTNIARSLFQAAGYSLIIEEDRPTLANWQNGNGVIFVDPIDGSAELGSGGVQFCAAVSIYNKNGLPIFSAAASPGIRPVYREDSKGFDEGFTYRGFIGKVGAIIFGGPNGVELLPLESEPGQKPVKIRPPAPRSVDNPYANVSLDPNRSSHCGLQKALENHNVGLARMPFSNIFSQMQVILGQSDAATLGPTPKNLVDGKLRGPKAWDLIAPLVWGAGLSYFDQKNQRVDRLARNLFSENFLLNRRLFICHKEKSREDIREISRLFSKAYAEDAEEPGAV